MRPHGATKNELWLFEIACVVIADNLSKASSTQDASQLWIQTPEQSSSPTRMAATGNLETINSSQQEQLSNNYQTHVDNVETICEVRSPRKSNTAVTLSMASTTRFIADNLSKAGWSWGCVSAIDFNGRTLWITDAHRDDGKRFVVRADEKLTAFLELESAIHATGYSSDR